jgi:hypothetical protein
VISGFFDPESDTPYPVVWVTLELPSRGVAGQRVPFLIDTGATTSCLHPFDAARFLIRPDELDDANRWQRSESHGGVGGHGRYYVVDAVYTFAHEDGTTQSIDGEVRIAQFTNANAELPSLLGWDVLQQFALTADWRTKTITLS